VVLPAKLQLDAEYLASRTTRGDLAVMSMTIGQVLGRTGRA
jgi:lipopolysaccharide/colanic/teichoic acid biosynthesis glycosyltransferase